VAKDRGQVDYNSKTIRQGNGQRNPSHLSRDASESDH
jgi:hypothetical protein